VIAPEISERQLKQLQREMIRAGAKARRDPTPVLLDRARHAALAYEHARNAWSR